MTVKTDNFENEKHVFATSGGDIDKAEKRAAFYIPF